MRAFFRNTAFGLVLVFMVSCGSTMEESTFQPTYNTESLSKDYASLHSDLTRMNTNMESVTSRSFLSRFFERVLNVFVADCVGAIKGAFKGENIWQSAQGASCSSARKQGFIEGVDAVNTLLSRATLENNNLVTSKIQPKKTALDGLILVDSSTATLEDSIGFFHNNIIYTTLEKDNSITHWKDISDEDCLNKLNAEITKVSKETTYKDTILNKSTIEFCQFISNTSVEAQNYKALLESTKKAYPQLGNMLDITSVYFEGMELVTTEEEWQQYCKNVIKTISNSSIPSKDKDALKMGVTVGYASSKLWKCE